MKRLQREGYDVEVPATVTVDGKQFKNVGVRFRGNSSYFGVPAGYKHSLNVTFDFVDKKQRLYGYKTLNLLNCNQDPTMMHSVLFCNVSRQYFPTPQATVLFGHVGIARDDPDFFAAFLLNEAFGGGRFTARLMSEVREKRGLTYGIGSYLVGMDQAEMYLGQFSASNDKVAEAISVLRAEWSRIATEGLTEEEVATTKTYLTGSYPLRFDGNGNIASILVGMQMDGMPIDYAVTRNAKIEAVTMADIKRVAARLYQPEALHFVVVGQPTGL